MLRRRLFVCLLVGVVLVLSFWAFSRYPDLNAKAAVGTSHGIADFMSTWPLLPLYPDQSLSERILFSSVNWLYANWKGMTFGLLLAALIMTGLEGWGPPRGGAGFGGAVRGTLLGAPIGLCVNCAAPVMRGILAGSRPEMALAAMVSSPTLNVVVLTMIFSMFPLYVGVLKVLTTLLLLFAVIPLLTREFDGEACPVEPRRFAAPPSFRQLGREFLGHLAAVTRTMTPLMVLASLFGSALVHGVELSWAWESNPQTLALAAVVSTLLPVPMAFDVILSHAFYTLGMPVGLVVTLLCGLGPFSVFAFVVTWRTISPRVATGFLGATMLVALAAGVLTPWIHHRLYIEPLLRGSRLSSFPVGQAGPDPVVPEPAVFAKLPPAVPFVVVQDTGEVRVEARGFRPSEAVQKQHFRYREGPEIGLRSGFAQEIRDYPDPFWIGRGTASGDIDGDDWPDVVFGSNHGPLIYRNHGGRFAPQPRAPIPIRTWKTYAVALVDLDGDGALDLYFSTFNRGTYCALNRSGAIDWRTLRQVPNGGGILTVAPAFADVDLDGEIDIVAGNMALGIVTGFRELGQGRRNALILNRRGRFEAWDFPGPDAETMSTLISDLDGDGQVDIYFSNDFNAADRLYRGRGGGTFQEHSFSGPTPVFSMSADSGDVNGDGRVDLSLSGTIALKPWVARKGLDGRSGSEAVSMPSLESVCAEVQDLFSREQCRRLARSHAVLARHRAIDPRGCDEQETRQEQQECWLAVGWSLVTRESVTDVCPSLEEPMLRELCAILARRGPRLSGEGARQLDDPQLLLRGPDGYEALPFSHPGGWTWNTRVVDVDGDGWLDLLGAEGVVGESQPGFNTLMMNHQGTRFSFEAFSRGWTNRLDLYSYTVVDYDLDGDPDIIGNGSVGPVQVFENHRAAGKGWLGLQLRDEVGNRRGVGSRLILDVDGRSLTREVKLSGGYQSFDDLSLRVGLGAAASANHLEVVWPDGKRTTVAGPFSSGHEYRVTRLAAASIPPRVH